MTRGATAGGAAGAGGFSFQDSVAAWAAVGILGEQAVTPRWDLAPTTYLTEIRCETGLAVDDLAVVTSTGGAVYIQVKRVLRLSKSPDSDLASAVDQFVRHFLAQRSASPGPHPWDRPLNPEIDRLVLMTDARRAPEWARVHLPAVLDRFRRDSRYATLVDTSKNAEEKDAAETLLIHIGSAWRRATGSDPSAGETRDLLALIRADCLDLRIDQIDGADDRSAMDWLRQAILVDPAQAEIAYKLLKNYCGSLVTTRGGSDRAELQKALIRHPIAVRPARGLGRDVERVREMTQRTLSHSSELSVIEMDRNPIKIERPVVSYLLDAIGQDNGNVLVIGDPGAGKSGVLHDAVRAMSRLGWDVVFVSADVLGAESVGDLRHDLGTDLDLTTLLERWDGSKLGVLVIDALDAARAEQAARVLRNALGQVVRLRGRWRVVASIRKFDLRCSAEWQELFRGSPVSGTFADPEFPRVRHVNIPLLDQAELDQVAEQAPELGALLRSTQGQPLFDLLRQPFNLRLAAALIADGLDPAELTPLRTQIELLDRYWERRVLGADSGRLERFTLARSVCELMIQRQALRVPLSKIQPDRFHEAIHRLMSQGVLSQPTSADGGRSGSEWVAFSHHVLFDYAAARTLLRDDPEDLGQYLTRTPGLVLLIRPSLSLHFQHLWLRDDGRTAFWRAALQLLDSGAVPRVGQLIGPEVAANAARSLADFQALQDKLQGPEAHERELAERAVGHVVGALLASGRALLGDEGGHWVDWAEQLSLNLTPQIVGSLQTLLANWMEKISQMTASQRRAVGVAARQLLRFAEREPAARTYVYFVGIAIVCRTYDSDPDDSRVAIEALLESSELDSARVEAFNRLAFEIRRLILAAPEVAERVYAAILGTSKPPDVRVSLGASKIVPLSISLRDILKGAAWSLAEAFPTFLEVAPKHSLRSLAAALDVFIDQTAAGRTDRRLLHFPFRGNQARYVPDASYVWDEARPYAHEAAVRMLDALERRLETLADVSGSGEFTELLDLIVDTQSNAVVWCRLMGVGIAHCAAIGKLILPLVQAEPVLALPDTFTEAGRFLSAVFPSLDAPSRRRVEEVILGLTGSELLREARPEYGAGVRDRLLGCLSLGDVVTETARQRLEEMHATQSVPPNEPPFRSSIGWVEETERERWEHSGLPYDAPHSVEFRRHFQPVDEFATKFLNDTPGEAEIATVVSALRTLADFLNEEGREGLHQELATRGQARLAACLRAILRNDRVFDQADFVEFARSMLLKASEHPRPQADPESNDRFDRFPSWDNESPRVEAAQGLMLLARDARGVSPGVLRAIRRLARDPSHTVRFMIAHDLVGLHRVAPTLMWRLINVIIEGNEGQATLFALAQGALGPLLSGQDGRADRVINATERVLAKLAGKARDSGHDAVNQLWGILLRAYLHIGHMRARELLFGLSSEPAKHASELNYLGFCLREVLDERVPWEPVPRAQAVRARAWGWFNDACDQAVRAWRGFQEAFAHRASQGAAGVDDATKETAQSLMQLIDSAAMQLYFASGAEELKGADASREARPARLDAERRFLANAKVAIGHLADAGLTSAAHHLVELLQAYVDVDPKGVFLTLARIVKSSLGDGYQYEPLAVSVVVRIVERYLADYRAVLREDEDCQRRLIEILDAFVNWPQAHRLAFRLGEVFR